MALHSYDQLESLPTFGQMHHHDNASLFRAGFGSQSPEIFSKRPIASLIAAKGPDGLPFKGSNDDLATIKNFKRFKRKGSSSRYKGVFFVKKEKKYRAQICLKGKKKYVGTFANDKDAAMARDQKIRELFGEVEELLNFPKDGADIGSPMSQNLDNTHQFNNFNIALHGPNEFNDSSLLNKLPRISEGSSQRGGDDDVDDEHFDNLDTIKGSKESEEVEQEITNTAGNDDQDQDDDKNDSDYNENGVKGRKSPKGKSTPKKKQHKKVKLMHSRDDQIKMSPKANQVATLNDLKNLSRYGSSNLSGGSTGLALPYLNMNYFNAEQNLPSEIDGFQINQLTNQILNEDSHLGFNNISNFNKLNNLNTMSQNNFLNNYSIGYGNIGMGVGNYNNYFNINLQDLPMNNVGNVNQNQKQGMSKRWSSNETAGTGFSFEPYQNAFGNLPIYALQNNGMGNYGGNNNSISNTGTSNQELLNISQMSGKNESNKAQSNGAEKRTERRDSVVKVPVSGKSEVSSERMGVENQTNLEEQMGDVEAAFEEMDKVIDEAGGSSDVEIENQLQQ